MVQKYSTGMTRQEAGRKGAEARWGTKSSSSVQTSKKNSKATINRHPVNKNDNRLKRGTVLFEEEFGPLYYDEIGRNSGRSVYPAGRSQQGQAARKGLKGLFEQRLLPAFVRNMDRREARAIMNQFAPEFYSRIGKRVVEAIIENYKRFAEEAQSEMDLADVGYTLIDDSVFDRNRFGTLLRWENDEDEEDEELFAHHGAGRMSRQEAGRKGGLARASQMTHEDYSKIGRKGGKARHSSR